MATKLIPEIRHKFVIRKQITGTRNVKLKARHIRLDLIQMYKILHGVNIKIYELN